MPEEILIYLAISVIITLTTTFFSYRIGERKGEDKKVERYTRHILLLEKDCKHLKCQVDSHNDKLDRILEIITEPIDA